MEELTRTEIDDWLEAHDMVMLGCFFGRLVWIYHRDTQCGSWVNWEFIRKITNADAGIWPMEYFL